MCSVRKDRGKMAHRQRVKQLNALRKVATVLTVLLAVLLLGWVYVITHDPYVEARGEMLALLETEPEELEELPKPEELDYEGIQARVSGARGVWGPLIKPPPPAPPKPPDLSKEIQGLTVATVIGQVGSDVEVIIRDPKSGTQRYKKGDKLRNLTIKEFTSTGVVLERDGRTVELKW